MRVFISSDMEGTAGIVDWDQVRPGGPDYARSCELLEREVNAAIEGAMAAGATGFVVNDSHGAMANLRPERLKGRARYISGRHKPMYMMQGLDDSFDAVFFVSYHGSMGAAASTLSHTYFPSSFAEVTINGVVAGEAGINALVALGCSVPIVLVTGDEVTAAELEPFCPSVRRAVVKRSVSRFAADAMHPDEACELIFAEASAAIEAAATAPRVSIELPATLRVTFKTSDYAELASRIAGVTRTATLTAELTGDDPIELYERFITIVLLCRGLRE